MADCLASGEFPTNSKYTVGNETIYRMKDNMTYKSYIVKNAVSLNMQQTWQKVLILLWYLS